MKSHFEHEFKLSATQEQEKEKLEEDRVFQNTLEYLVKEAPSLENVLSALTSDQKSALGSLLNLSGDSWANFKIEKEEAHQVEKALREWLAAGDLLKQKETAKRLIDALG